MTWERTQVIDRTPLPNARRSLIKEEAQIQAEIDAFESFLDRLDAIPPQPHRTDGGAQMAPLYSHPSPTNTPQDAVQTAYQETVLAVSHWKEAYGEESAPESMANEFGADVATGLTGGPATWSPLLWMQLRNGIEEAITNRQETRQLLKDERQQLTTLHDSLTEIEDELAASDRTNDSFADQSDQLMTILDRLEQLADDHQTYLRQREGMDEEMFSSFAYGDLDTDYPGLASLATARQLVDQIELRHWAGAR